MGWLQYSGLNGPFTKTTERLTSAKGFFPLAALTHQQNGAQHAKEAHNMSSMSPDLVAKVKAVKQV